ncbi:MAG: VCBS repeat-containing protein [Planctomycetota bacterium]
MSLTTFACFLLATGAQDLRFGEDRALVDWDDAFNTNVFLEDLDGDGIEDLILVGDGAIQRGLGRGIFRRSGTVGDGAASGAVGDADGDGELDLLLGFSSGGAALYLGDGNGALVEASGVGLPVGPVFGPPLSDVDLTDLEGDGDLDAFIAPGAFGTSIYRWDGAQYVGEALPAGAISANEAVFGDIDGDGDEDLFLANNGAFDPNQLLRNDGGNLTVAAGLLPELDPDETWDAAFGDLDLDGDLDLLVGDDFKSHVLRNDGTGAYAEELGALPAGIVSVRLVLLEDLDADGDLDALLGTPGGTPEFLLEGDGAAAFTPVADPLSGFEGALHAAGAADLDDDGDLDLVLGLRGTQSEVFLGDGALHFDTRRRKSRVELAVEQAVAGDLDNDGDDDLLVFAATIGGQRVFLNDGDGDLAELVGAVNPPAEGALDALLADLDGDADLDALTTPRDNGPVGLLRNQGGALLANSSADLGNLFGLYFGATLGDADSDGDLDVLVDLISLRYRVNDGTGVFSEAPAEWLPGTQPNGRLAMADFDLDGVDELFALNGFFENDGTGVLTLAAAHSSTQGSFGDIAVADMDGDLDLDVVHVDTEPLSGGNNAVWRFDGSSFTQLPLPAPFDGRGLAVDDFDGDGDADIVLGTGSGFRAFANQGDGASWVESPDALAGYGSATLDTLASFDADLDGDIDLFTGGRAGVHGRLWTNRQRHVVQREIATLSDPLSVDVFGPAGEAWVLSLSLGTTFLELPPFGILKVDPLLEVNVSQGLLDGSGEAVFTAVVPPTASLAGVTVFWQAAVGTGFQFTNLDFGELFDL